MMDEDPRFPASASLYEALRARPQARNSLSSLGLTAELIDHRLGEAADRAGVPLDAVDRALAVIEREVTEASPPV